MILFPVACLALKRPALQGLSNMVEKFPGISSNTLSFKCLGNNVFFVIFFGVKCICCTDLVIPKCINAHFKMK